MIDAKNDLYKLVNVCGHEVLFDFNRIDGEIPKGLYKYSLNYWNDIEEPAEISLKPAWDHAGDILSAVPFALPRISSRGNPYMELKPGDCRRLHEDSTIEEYCLRKGIKI